MELIHYADGSVLTGTAIARALIDYAQVLAANATAATVDIPTREPDGSIGRAQFLLGPASQIVSVNAVTNGAEVEDEELVRFLVAATEKQHGGEVRASDQDRFGGPPGVPEFGGLEPVDPFQD
jgi:hypothetical protein